MSGNTASLRREARAAGRRIPLFPPTTQLHRRDPYVLVLPTYGGGEGGAVPKQVIRFLNDEDNRSLIRGVIAAGNTNFGEGYCIAGDIVAAKCQVPLLYRFEVFGTPDDVTQYKKDWNDFGHSSR